MYIHFTEAQKQAARKTDLAAFLRRRSEELKRSGSEYEWRDGAQKVTIRGNVWFHQYERVGGDAIDFVRRFYSLDYPQAVELLLDGHASFEKPTQHATIQQKPTKKFLLPKRNNTMHRVYAYLLQQRGIDREVLNAFVREKMIYESAGHHNVVFVGYDQDGIAHEFAEQLQGQSGWQPTGVLVSPGVEEVKHCTSLKHQSICSRIFPCTRKTGKITATPRPVGCPTMCSGR